MSVQYSFIDRELAEEPTIHTDLAAARFRFEGEVVVFTGNWGPEDQIRASQFHPGATWLAAEWSELNGEWRFWMPYKNDIHQALESVVLARNPDLNSVARLLVNQLRKLGGYVAV